MASDGNRTFTEKLVWHFAPADWKRGSPQRRRKAANILSGAVQRGKEGYTWVLGIVAQIEMTGAWQVAPGARWQAKATDQEIVSILRF
jgi:hypothetical protein